MVLSLYDCTVRDIREAVAQAIRALAAREEFDGTPTDLLRVLGEFATSLDPRDWPRSPDALGRQIRYVVKPLRQLGIVVRSHRTPDSKRERQINIYTVRDPVRST